MPVFSRRPLDATLPGAAQPRPERHVHWWRRRDAAVQDEATPGAPTAVAGGAAVKARDAAPTTGRHPQAPTARPAEVLEEGRRVRFRRTLHDLTHRTTPFTAASAAHAPASTASDSASGHAPGPFAGRARTTAGHGPGVGAKRGPADAPAHAQGAQRAADDTAPTGRLARAKRRTRQAMAQVHQATPPATVAAHGAVDAAVARCDNAWRLRLDDKLERGAKLDHPKALLRSYVAERCALGGGEAAYRGVAHVRDRLVARGARPGVNGLSTGLGRGLAASAAFPASLVSAKATGNTAAATGRAASAALAWPLHLTLEGVDLAFTLTAGCASAVGCGLGVGLGYGGGKLVLALTPEGACRAFLRAHHLEVAARRQAKAATAWLARAVGHAPPPSPAPRLLSVGTAPYEEDPFTSAQTPSPGSAADTPRIGAGRRRAPPPPLAPQDLAELDALQRDYAALLAEVLGDDDAPAPGASPAELAHSAAQAQRQTALELEALPAAARTLLGAHVGEGFGDADATLRGVFGEANRRRQSAQIQLRRQAARQAAARAAADDASHGAAPAAVFKGHAELGAGAAPGADRNAKAAPSANAASAAP